MEFPEGTEEKIGAYEYPIVNQKRMAQAAHLSMFTSYMWFKDEGRHLIPKEVVLMMRTAFYGSKYRVKYKLFDGFGEPKNRLAAAYRCLSEPSKQQWMDRVGGLVEDTRKDSQEARDIAKALKGL